MLLLLFNPAGKMTRKTIPAEKMIHVKIFFVSALLLLFSCTTFLLEENIENLKKLENSTYTLKQEVIIDNKKLEKGQRVKLHIKTNDNSVRVYAYPADTDFLKSHRLLVLQMFDADFKNDQFDKAVFREKLFNVIQP
jgi:type II secretion system-associated lipoprotein